MVILKLEATNAGIRAKIRSSKLHAKAKQYMEKQPELAIKCSAEARACDELVMRITGHPLPGRARVGKESAMRTLDIEPMTTDLAPPEVELDSGLDYGKNGSGDSLGNGDVVK
jgi:hypothetical protein